jgi:predicted dehydrogenase
MASVVRVGIIGCGQVTQVIHLPNLNLMSHCFRVTYLCDVSPSALEHCAHRVVNHVPETTNNAATLCSSSQVDLVFVVNSDEYHCDDALLALQHDKHVFVEKPMALCERDADAIIEAEKLSSGRVMVGYMRRYAQAFVDAIEEVGSLDQITYVRVRGMYLIVIVVI